MALGTLLAPPLAMLLLYVLGGADFTPVLINPLLSVALTYGLMGAQGFALAVALEYGIQPRVRADELVVLGGFVVGALCGVAFPLVWLAIKLFLVCAGAGGIAGIAVGVLVRWMWWRAAQQSGSPAAIAQPARRRPWLAWLGIGVLLGAACLALPVITLLLMRS